MILRGTPVLMNPKYNIKTVYTHVSCHVHHWFSVTFRQCNLSHHMTLHFASVSMDNGINATIIMYEVWVDFYSFLSYFPPPN